MGWAGVGGGGGRGGGEGAAGGVAQDTKEKASDSEITCVHLARVVGKGVGERESKGAGDKSDEREDQPEVYGRHWSCNTAPLKVRHALAPAQARLPVSGTDASHA